MVNFKLHFLPLKIIVFYDSLFYYQMCTYSCFIAHCFSFGTYTGPEGSEAGESPKAVHLHGVYYRVIKTCAVKTI